jgi:PKD repeat protein
MKKNIFLLLAVAAFVKLSAQCSAGFSFSINASGNVSFTNTSAFTSSNVIYNWNFGNSQTSSQVNPSHTYTNNGNYLVDLMLYDSTSAGVCISNYTQVISVNNTTCHLTAFTNTYQLSYNTINFVNASTGTVALTQYTLHYGYVVPQSYFNSHFNVVHTFSAAALFPIQLRARNSSSCSSIYNASITVLSQTCTVNPNFSYTVNGSNVAFSNISTGTTSTTQFYWMMENGNNYSTQNPPNQNFLYNGTYTVTLYATDSVNYFCGGLITKTISITNAPCFVSSQFSMVKDSAALPAVVWNAIPGYSSNVVSAIWNWGDNTTSTGLFPSHTYSSTGTYSICLTVSVACGQTSTSCMSQNIYRTAESSQIASVKVINTNPTTISEQIQAPKLAILFPNPNKGNLQLYSKESLVLKMSIYNLAGKKEFEVLSLSADGFFSIRLPEHLEGVYFVEIEEGSRKQSERLVIVKD